MYCLIGYFCLPRFNAVPVAGVQPITFTKFDIMSQAGKSSIKRGKPSYFMAILGVTVVLFLLGTVGWITINSKKLMQYFKESVEVQVFLQPNIKDTARETLQNYIAAKPYVKNIRYTDKETAKKEWLKSGGEDFTEFLDNALLPTSIDFTLKEEFVDSLQLTQIKTDIAQNPIVDEVKYPNAVVDKMQRNFRVASLALGVIALLMAIAVIVLIDNTIRLAMFSNRFLIKTMQMVGATRWFIAKPLDSRAIINGAISGLLAIAGVYAMILFAERLLPDLQSLRDNRLLFLLFFILIIVGISISLFSTHRSVIKYLRLKLDELY
ncbi:MAG: permease-like cell division protein FtsX [Bacteroidota bacterium]